MDTTPDVIITKEDIIVSSPNVMHGAPCIGWTRIPVYAVLEKFLESRPLHSIARAYPHLTPRQVTAAINYAISVLRFWEKRINDLDTLDGIPIPQMGGFVESGESMLLDQDRDVRFHTADFLDESIPDSNAGQGKKKAMEAMMAEVTDRMYFNHSQLQNLGEYLAANVPRASGQKVDVGLGTCAVRLLGEYRAALSAIAISLDPSRKRKPAVYAAYMQAKRALQSEW